MVALRQENMHEPWHNDAPMTDERELGALLRLLASPPQAWLESAAAIPYRLRGLEPPAPPQPSAGSGQPAGSEHPATLAEHTR